MKLLFVDTCGAAAGVAVSCGDRIIAETNLVLDRLLSARLLSVVDTLFKTAGMTAADLDGIGVAIGPGSFTGIRIGVATVKGMAHAAGVPVVGISSLALLAASVPYARHQVCSLMDARKKEVYAGFFSCDPLPVPRGPEQVVSPDALLDTISEPTIFVGDGVSAYKDLITARCARFAFFAPAACSLPRGASGIVLTRSELQRGEGKSPDQLRTVYLRASEAEMTKRLHDTTCGSEKQAARQL